MCSGSDSEWGDDGYHGALRYVSIIMSYHYMYIETDPLDYVYEKGIDRA